MKKKKKSLFYTLLKTAITLLLLFLVFNKISFAGIWEVIKQTNSILFTVSLCLFLLSQWVSAERLQVLFMSANFFLSSKSNYVLYLIGMFYNFFIPGGIGGDAYKVYILNKEFKWPIKKLTAALFADRFIGLTAIGTILLFTGIFTPLIKEKIWLWGSPIALIIGISISYAFTKRLFPYFVGVYTKTLGYSIVVQLLQCSCIILLLLGTSSISPQYYMMYAFVFLISSVLSVFSFSGIGVREMVFYQASSLFVFDATVAVSISILFSMLTALVSLFGIVFHIKGYTPKMKNMTSISIPNT